MTKPRICVESSSLTTIALPLKQALNDLLSFPASTWVKGPYNRKTKKGYVKRIISTVKVGNVTEYFIPTGLVPVATQFLENQKIPFELVDESLKRGLLAKPVLKGIEFRPDQMAALKKTLREPRGVIVFPTGTGKTVLAAGIFSSYGAKTGRVKCLFLAHTIDLVKQAAEEFKSFGFKVGVIQGENKSSGDIVCATRQTIVKMSQEEMNVYDVIIVDETHHIAEFGNEYFKILMNCDKAYAKYGFTATQPTTIEAKWALRAAIGPVLAEVTINDANDMGILAKPHIKMVAYKGCEYTGAEKAYRDFYNTYIVNNRLRNARIVDIVQEEVKHKRSCLLFITNLKQGTILETMLKHRGIDCIYVHGKTDSVDRMSTKKTINDKKCLVVICSVIWKEGVSIKSLNNIILAGGGKDSKGVMQAIGRGTRLDTGKTEVTIWDFLDDYKYLAEHCIGRMRLYKESGWDVEVVL